MGATTYNYSSIFVFWCTKSLKVENPFKIHESYIIRHKILEALYKNDESKGGQHNQLGSIAISSTTGYSIDKIHFYHQLLKEGDEIECCEENQQHLMTITDLGDYAFVKKKYMKEGRNEMWDYFHYPTKVILPVITFGLAVFAFYLNYMSYKDQKQWRIDQKQLQNNISKSSIVAKEVDSIPSHQ